MVEEAFRRARRPDQKRRRRGAILDAAAQMLDQGGVDGVSLNRIAGRVGLAKSNLYRYYESREQILLELLLEDLQGFSDEIARRIAPLVGHNSPAAVAEVVATSLVSRPRLCELNSALVSSVERALSDGAKVDLGARMDAAVAAVDTNLRAALPAVPDRRSGSLVRAVLALAAGLWPMTRWPLNSRQASGDQPTPSFRDELERSVRALLYGLLVEGWRESGRRVTPP